MLIIAHRGYSAKYPQNSLLAFEKAIQAGVDMIETDIRLSCDDVPFVFHDSTLSRLGNTFQGIEDLRASTLETLRIQEQSIPTLEALLNHINGRTKLILEIKYHPQTFERIANIIMPLIEDKLEWIEVSSFNDAILNAFHVLSPALALHKLIEDGCVLEQSDFDTRYAWAWAFDIDILLYKHPKTQALLNTQKVIFWTVDHAAIEHYLHAYGAMANDPHILHDALKGA